MTSRQTLRKPYSVRATKPMGTVDMKQPAMGMKLQRKTKRDSRPVPGIISTHIPIAVRAVFTNAILACMHSHMHQCRFMEAFEDERSDPIL